MVSRDTRVNLLIGTGHFLSHFYQISLPPLFLVWQKQFDISFGELGLAVVFMTATAAVTAGTNERRRLIRISDIMKSPLVS